MKHYIIPLMVGSLLLNGIFIAFLFLSKPDTPLHGNADYPFLSKRIFSENQNDILINFTDLRSQLQTYISSLPVKTGVYFEYLPSGTSIGLNEKERFIPASLIKVPIVMAIYKKIESGKLRKNDMVALEDRFKDETSGSLWERPSGSQIAIQDAINMTLDDSDNTAKNILLSKLTRTEVSFVFDALDISLNDQNEEESTVAPKNYSSILRSLYLSSYLTRTHSNEILELLSQSNDDLRIRAGIPNGVIVASKFGISYGVSKDESVYSDCGIIYVPSRPFLLCIMIKGSESRAYSIMQEIANRTYSYVVRYQL